MDIILGGPLGAVAVCVVGSLFLLACVPRAWLRSLLFLKCEFFHRSVCEILAILLCVGGFVHYGATKQCSRASATVPARPSRTLQIYDATVSGTVAFPAFTGGVREGCITGIMPSDGVIFLRAQWPTTLPAGATALDLYASPTLSPPAWVGLGTVSLPTTGDSLILEVPSLLLPWNSEHTSFFGLGLNNDSDGDGLTDAEERILTHTAPSLRDTDGDGISDGDEISLGTNPCESDSDDDGISDLDELGSVCQLDTFVWYDTTGGVDLLADEESNSFDDEVWTVPLCYPAVLGGMVYDRITIDSNALVYLIPVGAPPVDVSNRSYERIPTEALALTNLAVAVNWQDMEAVKGNGAAIRVADISSEGCTVVEYANVQCYGDASKIMTAQVVVPGGTEGTILVSYFSLTGDLDGQSASVGLMDSTSRRHSEANRLNSLPWSYDEAGSISEGMTLAYHVGSWTNPLLPDTDGDGLDDGYEIDLGLDPCHVDTDRDGLPDDWEIEYGLNPTDASGEDGAAGDPDRDGLSNIDEYRNGCNPQTPHSDNDGIDDETEVQQGSDPNDPSDGGNAPPVDRFRELVFNIYGDYASWEMTIKGLGPEDRSVRKITMGEPDSPQNVPLNMRKGNSYRLSMRWLNCDGHSDAYDWFCWQAKIDDIPSGGSYRRYSSERLPCNEILIGSGWVAENRGGLLSGHVHMHDPDEDGVGGGNVAGSLVATLYVLDDPKLIPDYDRDGEIGSRDEVRSLESGSVFRFWINDDEDSLATEGKFSEFPRVNIPGAEDGWLEFDRRDPDCSDGRVNGVCDLLDLTPILADASCVVRGMPKDIRDRLALRLRHKEGAANVIWTGQARTSANAFMKKVCSSGFGENLSMSSTNATVSPVLSSGCLLPTVFANRVKTEGGVFLIEGCAPTVEPLWLEVLYDSTIVCSNKLELSISSVEQMYRSASLRGAVDDPMLQIPVPDIPPNQPDGTKDLDVFFLHGFNVDEEAARAWGAEVFKRLWQSGSNARFHILPWHGDYSWSFNDWFNGLHYQHNVWYAQRTGHALKSYIEAAQADSSKRILMTQSLGNMVACEALRQGLYVSQYYMFDAAVASEALEGTLRAEGAEDASFEKYVRPEWRSYTSSCWSANWYRLYSDSSSDARRQMGWTDRFKNALTNATEVFNYYSSGDTVFTEMDEVPALLDDTTHFGVNWYLWIIPSLTVDITFENHCWQKQEVMKGMVTAAGTLSGGWGFNSWLEYDSQSAEWKSVRYSPEGAAIAVGDRSIVNRPAFDVSDAAELMNPNASEDDIFLALAKHVPALSSPVGGNEIASIRLRANEDLNTDKYRNGWGRREDSYYGLNWLHSDMKDMAYFYVYKLYDEIVNEKGHLK